jgi:stringent starvation protein B
MTTTGGPITDNQGSSTRPYLLRALHDWCTDNGFTPYIAVHVDETVQVPREHVKNNEIVLNVGFEATSGLKLGNEAVEFRARFGGVSRDIVVPVDHVVAIYARENGQGMAFPIPTPDSVRGPVGVPAPAGSGATPAAPAVRSLRLATGADETPGSDAAPAKGGKRVPPVLQAAPAKDQDPAGVQPGSPRSMQAPPETPDDSPPKGPRPSLKRVK